MSMSTRAVTLSRYGFARLRPARWTWWLAVAWAVFAALGAADASPNEISQQLRACFRWTSLLIAVPIAAALADDPRRRSRMQGVDALGDLAGIPPRHADRWQWLVAVLETAARMALPMLTLALTALMRFPGTASALQLVGSLVAVLATAALFVGIALVCGRLAAERGRRLWWAVLLLPWVLSQRLPVDVSLIGVLNRIASGLLGGFG